MPCALPTRRPSPRSARSRAAARGRMDPRGVTQGTMNALRSRGPRGAGVSRHPVASFSRPLPATAPTTQTESATNTHGPNPRYAATIRRGKRPGRTPGFPVGKAGGPRGSPHGTTAARHTVDHGCGRAANHRRLGTLPRAPGRVGRRRRGGPSPPRGGSSAAMPRPTAGSCGSARSRGRSSPTTHRTARLPGR